jgi:hypothetical protein
MNCIVKCMAMCQVSVVPICALFDTCHDSSLRSVLCLSRICSVFAHCLIYEDLWG